MRTGAHRVRSIEQWNRKTFLYVKVGREDAVAFPDLVFGSVLRVDPSVTRLSARYTAGRSSRRFFLVEHSKGFTCCRLNFIDTKHIGLISNNIPFANLEFHLGKEIKILGVVDLELRPLKNVPSARVSVELSKDWRPAPIPQDHDKPTLSELISSFRLRNGLQFRDASALSKEIAEDLGDTKYFLTPHSLLGYERLDTPPRHIHKIMSLCTIYCIVFWDFLRSAGMSLEQLGQEPLPEKLLPRLLSGKLRRPPSEDNNSLQMSGLPETLFEEIPLFLRSSLSALVGLSHFSIRDVFWTSGSRQLFHPLLPDSCFVIVNRRVKRSVQPSLSKPWESPLCLILMRTGDYICSPCVVKNGVLILHPHPDSSVPSVTLRNRDEAEIIGRVVAIVRRL